MNHLDKNWYKTILPRNVTIADVISALDSHSLKISLIVDEKNSLIGTVTDGDIRRALLKGLDLKSSIKNVININPFVVTPNFNRQMVKQLMISNKIQQIPVVDEKNQIVGLHSWDKLDTLKVHSNIMIIMAGGKGTRLLPLTLNCPKPLLPVNGKPVLEYIINRAKYEGITQFVIAINYLGHMIKDYFGDGERFGVRIEYLEENSPLGTAGALSLVDSRPEKPFIVTNGDVLTNIDYSNFINFHEAYKASATVAVRSYEWQNPFGVVDIKGIDIVGFKEKPIVKSYINAGIYVLESSTLDFLEKSKYCDMPVFLNNLQLNFKRIIAFPIHEFWNEIGNPNALREIEEQDKGSLGKNE